MSASLNGNDSITLDENFVLTDLADGDAVVLDFPNDIVGVKVGKNGNALYAFNATGKQVDVTLRVLRATVGDRYLNKRLDQFLNDPPSFVLFEGEFIKRVGDGAGNVNNDVYSVEGGVISKLPPAKDNLEGDTEQAVSVYVIKFANSDRSLG